MKIRYAAAAMAAIILVQMILAVSVSWHAAEVFSTVAVSALFFYCIIRLVGKSLKNRGETEIS